MGSFASRGVDSSPKPREQVASICYRQAVRVRPLGKTGIECSELGLGTWGLSGDAYGPVASEDQDRVLARAVGLGITLFESADTYGDGTMLRRLGRILGRDQRYCTVVKLGTMLKGNPPRKRFDRAFLNDRLANVSKLLEARSPDVVLLHNPSEQVITRGEALGLLSDQVACGAARSWGVSAGSRAVAAAAIDAGAPIVELAFNILWADDFRAIEQMAKSRGTGLIARSVLAHGLLAGTWPNDRQFAAGDHRSQRWTTDELRQRIRHLDAIRPLLAGEVQTMRSAALRWALSHELVSSLALGPRNCSQLDQLVRDAGKGPPYLPEGSLDALETRLRDLGARP
jgi:aryl-alcohol dehydrogenase-like predicted oxidoreductase